MVIPRTRLSVHTTGEWVFLSDDENPDWVYQQRNHYRGGCYSSRVCVCVCVCGGGGDMYPQLSLLNEAQGCCSTRVDASIDVCRQG